MEKTNTVGSAAERDAEEADAEQRQSSELWGWAYSHIYITIEGVRAEFSLGFLEIKPRRKTQVYILSTCADAKLRGWPSSRYGVHNSVVHSDSCKSSANGIQSMSRCPLAFPLNRCTPFRRLRVLARVYRH